MQDIQWDNVPEKYKKWTSDYDSSMQSYKQLKNGAKFIFSKLKSNNTPNNVSINQLNLNDVEPGEADEESDDYHENFCGNKENLVNVSKEFDELVIGSHGEVYKINENLIHIYDWIPRNVISESINLNDKTLYHIHTVKTPHFSNISKISKIFPIYYNRITKNIKILYILRTSINSNELYIFDLLKDEEYYIPFKVNTNLEYFSKPVDSSDYFILIDKTNQILNVFDYETLSLINKFNIEFINDIPIFDLRGKFLIFNINSKFKYLINKNQLNSINLSSKNNLLNKLIKSFSNTALDSMLLFSEVSQNKISKLLENRKKPNKEKTYMDQNDSINNMNNNDDGNDDELEELINDDIRDNYRDIFIELYNTINKSSSYVKLVDLSINSTIFQLSIPMGCSKISMSPFDLQFLTVNYRGDELYLWDFTNLNNDSIILIDKYIRGKTSSIIETIDWGIGNSTVLCLSKQNGSLHSFINESLRNYEDLKTRKKNGNRTQTQKPWCLSSLKLKDFTIIRIVFIMDFIIGIDRDNNLLLINLETGNIEGFIDFKKKFKTQETNIADIDLLFKESDIKSQVITTLTNKEVEIETCKPYLPSYNNKNFKFKEIENFEINFNNFINLSENVKTKKTFKIGSELYENRYSEINTTEINATEINATEIDTPLTSITPVTSIPSTPNLACNEG